MQASAKSSMCKYSYEMIIYIKSRYVDTEKEYNVMILLLYLIVRLSRPSYSSSPPLSSLSSFCVRGAYTRAYFYMHIVKGRQEYNRKL